MKVKVTKANKHNYWYNTRIGEEFEVTRAKDGRYCKESGSWIDASDCEVVEEKDRFLGKMVRVLKSDRRWLEVKVGQTGLCFSEIDYENDVKVAFADLQTYHFIKADCLEIIEEKKPQSLPFRDIEIVAGNVIEVGEKIGIVTESPEGLVVTYVSDITGYDYLNEVVSRIKQVYEGTEGRPFGINDYTEYPKGNKVKLNDSYDAEILEKSVKVGCQEFPFEVVLELAEKINVRNKSNKSS